VCVCVCVCVHVCKFEQSAQRAGREEGAALSDSLAGQGDEQHALDVARAVPLRRSASKLVENDLHRLLHHIVQHIEAATVGHADDDALNTELCAPLHHSVHAWEEHLTPVDAESLL